MMTMIMKTLEGFLSSFSYFQVSYHAAVPGWEEEAEKATESKVESYNDLDDHNHNDDADMIFVKMITLADFGPIIFYP